MLQARSQGGVEGVGRPPPWARNFEKVHSWRPIYCIFNLTIHLELLSDGVKVKVMYKCRIISKFVTQENVCILSFKLLIYYHLILCKDGKINNCSGNEVALVFTTFHFTAVFLPCHGGCEGRNIAKDFVGKLHRIYLNLTILASQRTFEVSL